MSAKDSGGFWNSDAGCWMSMLILALCILCVTGFALLNQLNLLFMYVIFGFGIYFLSGAGWFSYKGLKELHRIRKQKRSRLWENDSYVVQEFARPLPISIPLLSSYHYMDTLSPRIEGNRVLKRGKRSLPEWQQNIINGFFCLVCSVAAFQSIVFHSEITTPDIINRILLCIFLVFMLCLLVGITIGIIRSMLRKMKAVPEIPENTDLVNEA